MEALISKIAGSLWQWAVIPLILFTGLFLTLRLNFLPLRAFFSALKKALPEKRGKGEGGGLSPFRAMTTALGATVGTGSIVGSCQAVLWGGAGALFWMWVAAFLGMSVKFSEIALAVHYRRREGDRFLGGPMYYMEYGLGHRLRPMAKAYALFALLSGFGMGNLAQCNAFREAIGVEGGGLRLLLGVGIALILALLLRRGIEGVSRATGVMVPFMSLGYLFVCLGVVLLHRNRLPALLLTCMREAFSLRGATGGALGFGVGRAMEWGLRRGTFSHEAGLGSGALVHGSAEAKSPYDQGLFGILEVTVATLLVCTLTALALLLALPGKLLSAPSSPMALLSLAFSEPFGMGFSRLFLLCSVALFALSTLLGWTVYGSVCSEYLWGKRGRRPFLILFVLACIPATVLPSRIAWSLADLSNALMALPNLASLLFLSSKVQTLIPRRKRKTIDKSPPLC